MQMSEPASDDMDIDDEQDNKMDDDDEQDNDRTIEQEVDIDVEEEEHVEEEEEPLDSEDGSTPSPPVNQPRLKIKLRLPQILSPNAPTSTGTSTPTAQLEEASQPPSRRELSRDIDIESEDEDDETSALGSSGRPMTARQAVLASVVGSSHVSLSETSRKKKQLNETELALRREETARKRRNLSEKKLEDEKVETINRLLKKQSKSKNKRNALSTADDRTPLSATPALVSSTADGLQDGENSEPVQVVPTMYRWISTAKPSNPSKGKSPVNKEESMRITFSIPASLPKSYVTHSASQQYWWGTGPPPDQQRICDVDGCKSVRKYGLVRDSSKSACGMDHLKVLERQIGSA